MYTKLFWLKSFERAMKAAANNLIVVSGLGDGLLNIFTLDVVQMAGFALGALVVSLLMSLASAPIGDEGSPSLITTP